MGKHEDLILELIFSELEDYGEWNAFKRRTIRTLPDPIDYDVYVKHYGRFQSRTKEVKDGKHVRVVKGYPKSHIEKFNRDQEEKEGKSKQGS
jgi:hypothetical protein